MCNPDFPPAAAKAAAPASLLRGFSLSTCAKAEAPVPAPSPAPASALQGFSLSTWAKAAESLIQELNAQGTTPAHGMMTSSLMTSPPLQTSPLLQSRRSLRRGCLQSLGGSTSEFPVFSAVTMPHAASPVSPLLTKRTYSNYSMEEGAVSEGKSATGEGLGNGKRRRLEAMAKSLMAGIDGELHHQGERGSPNTLNMLGTHRRSGHINGDAALPLEASAHAIDRRKMLAAAAKLLLGEMEGRTSPESEASIDGFKASKIQREGLTSSNCRNSMPHLEDARAPRKAQAGCVVVPGRQQRQEVQTKPKSRFGSHETGHRSSESLSSLSKVSSETTESQQSERHGEKTPTDRKYPVIFGVEMIPSDL